MRRSSLYETEPQELLDQPWFLNAVVEVETSLFPLQLLARIRQIEREMGRQRVSSERPAQHRHRYFVLWTHRDRTPELEVPHPRLAQRRFVLEPLAEIAPDFRHPLNRKDRQRNAGDTRAARCPATGNPLLNL